MYNESYQLTKLSMSSSMSSSTKSSVCQICDYNINISNRKRVECPYCSFDACRTCCETYILNEYVPKCMNTSCDREWMRQFTSSTFTASFLNTKYKIHREKILFDQERALLPATQVLVENIIKIENLTEKLKKIKIQIQCLKLKKNEMQVEIARLHYGTNAGVVEERREFIKACPSENCRGFLSTQWKCGICEHWACPTCHEIKGLTKDAEHTCNPDTVTTIALLTQDTKSCPKCQTGIHRISGCDQMWCTQCHTAFNWRTNKIENAVHNPHYFEWLRLNGNAIPRQPGDVPCQDNLTHLNYVGMQNILRTKHINSPIAKSCECLMEKITRNTLHMRYVILDRYRQINYVERNKELRISYMRNQITEDAFKIMLQRNEKKNLKSTEMRNVLTILLTTVTDIVFRFIEHLNAIAPNKFNMTILDELKPIINYVNECLKDIGKTYSSTTFRFDYNMLESTG